MYRKFRPHISWGRKTSICGNKKKTWGRKKVRKNIPLNRAMASAASTYARTTYMFPPKSQNVRQFRDKMGASSRKIRRVMRIHASQGPTKPPKPSPGVDTRIHWENPDEGWIGGGSDPTKPVEEEKTNIFSDDKFAELIKDSFDSHYQWETTKLIFFICYNDPFSH